MKCTYCGGRMVIEYFGSYGNVYPLKKDGEAGKKRIRRFLYEEDGECPLIYCLNCKRTRDDQLNGDTEDRDD